MLWGMGLRVWVRGYRGCVAGLACLLLLRGQQQQRGRILVEMVDVLPELARQLVRGGYALAGLVVAVMVWQLAAACV